MCLSNEENFCRPKKCLKGDARRSVEGLIMSTNVSPHSIMDILKRRFGRPYLVVRSLIEEAKNCPPVRNNDIQTLINFSEMLSNLFLTLTSLEMQNYLSPQLTDELVLKLPYGMQLAWGKKIAQNNGKYSIQEFEAWILKETEGASYVQRPHLNQTGYSRNFYDKPKRTLLTSNYKEKGICIACNEHHLLEKCKIFLNLSNEEKWKLVKQKNACFSCLNSFHGISKCRYRKLCGIENCNKYHHKLLHFPNIKLQNQESKPVKINLNQNEPSTSTVRNEEPTVNQIIAHTLQNYTTEIFLKIAPVVIRTSTKQIETYALFDDASTISMIDEELANNLDLVGEKTTLNLRWTDSKTLKTSQSRKVHFEVVGKNEDYFYLLENVYTEKDLDLPVQSINAAKLKSKWSHLSRIDFESMQQAQPKLLIGQDNWNLITTRELIEGPKNAPALSYTKLGWIVHGGVNHFKGTVDTATTLHIKQNSLCDDLLHEEVRHFFTTEAFGVKLQGKNKESEENELAVQIIDRVTKRSENRWETGLLWRDEEGYMPDSKSLAIQRFQYIEKRMLKDTSFAEDSRNKIKEYVEKGYARRLEEEEIKQEYKKVWYLPHFAVVNPNKPGKIRFVFDAAANVNGFSFNDFLLKGPDLYNSLVGMIWKFREKPIAFSADIKEMFHQVKIKSEDQHAQRFLFRNSPDEEVSTFVMQVMIFGAVSSPFSAQYVKNRNALEFQKEYPRAVEAILSRHYMDDYLDSVDTIVEAKNLIKQVIYIYKSGGFELRGWICNSKGMIEDIPQYLRGTEKVFGDEHFSQRMLGLK